MKNVFFDCTRLLSRAEEARATGIDRVDIRYLDFLQRSNSFNLTGVYQQDGQLFILPNKQLGVLNSSLMRQWSSLKTLSDNDRQRLKEIKKSTLGARKKIVASSNNKALSGLIDPLLVSQFRKKENNVYLNVSHHGLLDSDIFFGLNKTYKCEVVFYIHDIIPIDFPEYVRTGDEKNHQQRIVNAATFATLLLCNSEFTKTRLVKFCESNELFCPPTSVLHIGAEQHFLNELESDPIQSPQALIDVNSPYFVTIGTIEPRKNHLLLLNIWRDLVATMEHPPQLVIIGKRGWLNQSTFEFLDRCETTREYVREFSGLSDAQMISLLKGAKALLHPSFSEGWGMPLIESIAAGTPVIASDIDVFHEASQGLATYISPIDGIGWKQAVLEYSTEHSAARNAALDRLADFSMPTWEAHFLKFQKIISETRSIPSEIRRGKEIKDVTVYGIESAESNDNNSLSKLAKAVLPPHVRKKYEKFRRTPVRFLVDSKSSTLHNPGNFLRNGL